MVDVGEGVEGKERKKDEGEEGRGEDGGGVGEGGGDRGVEDELLLEHRWCYRKLNVMR